ncbi:hypothetical protein RHGRI_012576 [Rhododendron griersonianum]|uniref:Uncharacterized protein n=1 Tax=Rhododendron griersonianum TaxID=479676 RepID=A0AAV6KS39_9ERIC|nr:hypothetical protein RHGRI_012570 [Rhododendron griersonianum]KAG5555086.1 hypothetical protein RHGRI_012576 [Rhododendron griersonianum]
MSTTIEGKFKCYAPSSEVTDSNNTHNDFMPEAVNPGASLGFPLSKDKELEGTNSMPTTAIPKTCSGQLRNVPATFHSFHEFKKHTFVPSSEAFAPPIVFVPPVLEQSLGDGSSSAKTKNPA